MQNKIFKTSIIKLIAKGTKQINQSSGNAFVSKAGSLRFKTRAGQTKHSAIANGVLSLRNFFERSCIVSKRIDLEKKSPANSLYASAFYSAYNERFDAHNLLCRTGLAEFATARKPNFLSNDTLIQPKVHLLLLSTEFNQFHLLNIRSAASKIEKCMFHYKNRALRISKIKVLSIILLSVKNFLLCLINFLLLKIALYVYLK